MKAVLTLYVSAVVVIFFFHPTAKEYFPAKVEVGQVCFLSPAVKKLDVSKRMAYYFLKGNIRFPLRPSGENCYLFEPNTHMNTGEEGKILIVSEGRSLWNALTKK